MRALCITAHPATRRKYDIANLLEACKSYIDGLCDGLEIDDSQFVQVTVKRGEKHRYGIVLIDMESLE
jgi:Holliday junction resolvase RusA-like endonuclease